MRGRPSCRGLVAGRPRGFSAPTATAGRFLHLVFGEDRARDRRRRIPGARQVHHVGEPAVRKPHPPHAGVDFVADDLNDRSPASAVKRIAPPFQPVTTDNSSCFSSRLRRVYMFFWLNRARITRASPDPASIEEAALAISDSHRSNAELVTQVLDASVPAPTRFASGLDKSTFKHEMGLPLGAAYGLPDGAGPPGDPAIRPHRFYVSGLLSELTSGRPAVSPSVTWPSVAMLQMPHQRHPNEE